MLLVIAGAKVLVEGCVARVCGLSRQDEGERWRRCGGGKHLDAAVLRATEPAEPPSLLGPASGIIVVGDDSAASQAKEQRTVV